MFSFECDNFVSVVVDVVDGEQGAGHGGVVGDRSHVGQLTCSGLSSQMNDQNPKTFKKTVLRI